MSYLNKENNEISLELNIIQLKEERLRTLLGPLERYIIFIECVLIWEYPILFVMLFLVINIIFWLFIVTPFYCLIAASSFVFLLTQYFVNHIWPKIADTDENLDGWVKVTSHPDNYPDLISYLAVFLSKVETFYKICEDYRTYHRNRFNFFGICFSMMFLLISFFINKFYVAYFTAMYLLFWPGIKYHQILSKIFHLLRPYRDKLEKKLHIKRSIKINSVEDDSDMELNQFLLESNAVLPALSSFSSNTTKRDESNYEYDDDSESQIQDDLAPSRHNESRDFTDDDDSSDLVPTFSEMPSLESYMDGSQTHNDTIALHKKEAIQLQKKLENLLADSESENEHDLIDSNTSNAAQKDSKTPNIKSKINKGTREKDSYIPPDKNSNKKKSTMKTIRRSAGQGIGKLVAAKYSNKEEDDFSEGLHFDENNFDDELNENININEKNQVSSISKENNRNPILGLIGSYISKGGSQVLGSISYSPLIAQSAVGLMGQAVSGLGFLGKSVMNYRRSSMDISKKNNDECFLDEGNKKINEVMSLEQKTISDEFEFLDKDYN